MDYHQVIVRHQRISGGEPVIRGTRATLPTVRAGLAAGDTVADILRDFPTLTEQDVASVIAWPAAAPQEDLPTPGVAV